MKNIVLLSLFILISCSDVDNNKIMNNLMQEIQFYNDAMSKMDGSKLLKFYPAVLYHSEEDRIEILNGFMSQKEQMFNNGITIGKIKTSEPLKFSRIGNEVHAIMEQNMRIHSPVSNMTTKSFLYALSQDYGENWIIMDYDFIEKTFPDFQYEFKIDSRYSSVEDSCKHFSSDLFATKICIDRYIESGEYNVIDTFDVYSILEKSNQKMTLSIKELELVQKSINEWEREVDVKCIFPSISNETIEFIDHSIGRFYIQDIYGIPFEWKGANDTKFYKDTLPGSFKHHSILAFQNFKNTQKIDSTDNKFEILYDTEDFQ